MRAHLTLISLAALSGCATLTPKAPAPMVAEAPAHPEDWKAGELAPIPATGDWLTGFEDGTLLTLVSEALENNPDLMISVASVEASRAAAAIQYGNRLPSLNGTGSAAWVSAVTDVNDSPYRTETPSYGLTLAVSWEPDFWGRISTGIAEAEASLQAAEADLETAQLSLAASAAITWFQLKDAVRQEQLAEESLQALERTQTLTERRFRNGLTSALDVRTARSSVETARASLISRQRATGEARRAMEVLLGRYPANELEASGGFPVLGQLSGEADPTALLARRPDIRAAEARIAAAGFNVETARLAMKPSLALSATLSTSNDDLVDIFDPQYLAGQIASSLTAPLFNGGKLLAAIDAAEAQAKITSAQYVSTTLTAWQEVENAIAADSLLAAQVESQLRALEEARLAEDLAERQYQSGLSTIFNLIDAQTRRINAEGSLISAQSARAINRVRFHLALGGDLPASVSTSDILSEG